MLMLLGGIYLLLWRDRPLVSSARNWPNYAWATGMAALTVLAVHSTLHLQRAVRQEFAYRLPTETQSYLSADPNFTAGRLRYIAFTQSGYRLASAQHELSPADPSSADDLSFAANSGQILIEKARSPHSQIVNMQDATPVLVDNARQPMLSADGRSLAFIRDDHGQGRLLVRRSSPSDAASETALTPSSLNIYEASFRSEGEYAFSAVEDGRPPQIYLSDAVHSNAPLGLGESRYPALSPDGAWLAYSHLEHGVWNLWLRDQRSGTIRRIADVPCNQIQPAWEDDSKTLLYGTDCGRSLWFTAVARRRVIP
jgi:hypothetical protein